MNALPRVRHDIGTRPASVGFLAGPKIPRKKKRATTSILIEVLSRVERQVTTSTRGDVLSRIVRQVKTSNRLEVLAGGFRAAAALVGHGLIEGRQRGLEAALEASRRADLDRGSQKRPMSRIWGRQKRHMRRISEAA
jgi:hypothetical protein